MADITNVPEMLGQSLLAQPEFVQGIIKIMLHWEVYGVLITTVLAFRMLGLCGSVFRPLAAFTSIAFLLTLCTPLPVAFVVFGAAMAACALLADTAYGVVNGFASYWSSRPKAQADQDVDLSPSQT